MWLASPSGETSLAKGSTVLKRWRSAAATAADKFAQAESRVACRGVPNASGPLTSYRNLLKCHSHSVQAYVGMGLSAFAWRSEFGRALETVPFRGITAFGYPSSINKYVCKHTYLGPRLRRTTGDGGRSTPAVDAYAYSRMLGCVPVAPLAPLPQLLESALSTYYGCLGSMPRPPEFRSN